MNPQPAPLTGRADGPARVVIATETMVLPTGCTLENTPGEFESFAVYVRWMGPPQENGTGGWCVATRFSDTQLSRAGNWAWVPRFKRHQYRFDTFEAALAAAQAHVDQVTVNSRTWAAWHAHTLNGDH